MVDVRAARNPTWSPGRSLSGVGMTLSSLGRPCDVDPFPPEQAGVHRPDAGSEQRQGRTEGSQEDVNPRVGRQQEDFQRLNPHHHCSRDGCPETDEEKKPGTDEKNGQDNQQSRGVALQPDDSAVHQ